MVINNKSRVVPFLREEILETVASLVGEENVNLMKYVSQHNSTFNWFITFDEKFRIDHLFDREISIGSQKAKIEDPFEEYDPTFIYKYRVSWLPHNFDAEIVKDWFPYDIMNVEITEEFEKLEKFKHVKNGNLRVKIVCLFSRLGRPPKCFLCKQEGHVKWNFGEYLADLPEQTEDLEYIAKTNECHFNQNESQINDQPCSNNSSNETNMDSPTDKVKKKSKKKNKKKRELNNSEQMESDSKKEKIEEKYDESNEISDNESYSSNDNDSPVTIDKMVNSLSKQYSAPKGQSHNNLDSKLTKPF
ncbi:unnamed protein product [Brachionus calyciflorus]|uniref:Uncharacterized protein n=1 Tax=Brachionus calyciflorus TaxID=104777 RepID=A0A814C1R3_9BILA|nr:unnamed protein product [Brachionus calyciflorus]